MKIKFGVLAGLVFVSTVAIGQYAHIDSYNWVIEAQLDQYRAENSAIVQAPNALAGDNMRTDGQHLAKDTFSQSSGNDFYNGVLAAQVEGYIEDKNLVAPAPTLLAGNNMITGEQPQPGPASEDFYNRVLAAKVDEYIADNTAIAPSATTFAELQPMSEVPSSMAASVASNAGAQGERDWYDRVVAAQAELNRRMKKSDLPSTF